MTTKRSVLGVVTASFLMVFTIAFVAGCGGGGGASDPALPKETIPPEVVAANVTPKPGATVPKKALTVTLPFTEALSCFAGEQAFSDNGFTGKATCSGSVVTMKFDDASLAGKSNLTATLSKLTDLVGNAMVPFTWTYLLAPDLATVTLTATPTTVVVGGSTTLAWAPINAANCLASGGWTGSVSNTGGSQVVNPTTTTTYGIECWNSTNVSTGVVLATVTVTPKPVVTHPAAVVAFGSNWIHRVDVAAPQGISSITNRTGHEFYSYGFRATVLPNCQIQVSALDNLTFEPLSILYDRKKNEFTLDTSGTAPPRLVGNYVFGVMPDPAFPDTVINAVVGEERYYVLDTDHRSLWYRKGTAPAVLLGTYPIGIKAVVAYPACTVQ